MDKRKLLFLDDDKQWLSTISLLLADEYDLYLADSPEMARGILRKVDIDVAILDLNLEGHSEDGIGIYNFISEHHPKVPTAFLSSDTNTRRVRDASFLPKLGFVVKDGNFEDDLRNIVERGLVVRNANNISERNPDYFRTNSPAVKKLLRDVDRVINAEKESPILIFGESGTGKGELAKYIAIKSNKKLFSVNMGNLDPERAISELFGHVRGSFTGAIADKIGLIQNAQNNIFFMDEIGECSPDVQTKLLRAIQEKEISPLGSTIIKKLEVRFIAATHKDLNAMVEEKTFRLDLLQRLSTFTFKMPALRERKEDIPYYANIFLSEYSKNENINILASGYEALLAYNWPGNIRELQNVVKRVIFTSENKRFDADNVNAAIQSGKEGHEIQMPERGSVENILETLRECGGNRSQAAQKLNMSLRSLQRWIKKNGFTEISPSKSGRPQSAEGGL
jgi:DNA-binding NtrC family response regulator